ncbi:hypothetical protein [Moorena producens]|nr:hypothetical protein [Moorena producens]
MFTTITTLSSRFPEIVNFSFLPYTSIIGIVKAGSTDEQVRWNY